MKSYRIEKIFFIISVISFGIFVFSIPFGIFGDPFLVSNTIARTIYAYGSGVAPFVIIGIIIVRKKRGYNNPLSIEAMRAAKKALPNKIYKFCSLSSGGEKVLDDKKLYSLENKKIWMSDCSVLNDPYEGMYAFVEEHISEEKNEYFRYLIDKIKNSRDMYIQSSFSYGFDDILMWGHYANGCRGYCIEYTIKSKHNLFPVQYVDRRPLLSSITYSQEVKNNLDIIEEGFSKIENDEEKFAYMLYIQSIKSLSWSYEKEVRLIEIGRAASDSKCGNVDSEDYGLEISKIIIGCHCTYKENLIDIAKKLNVPVSIMEMPLNSKKYKLIEREIFSEIK